MGKNMQFCFIMAFSHEQRTLTTRQGFLGGGVVVVVSWKDLEVLLLGAPARSPPCETSATLLCLAHQQLSSTPIWCAQAAALFCA